MEFIGDAVVFPGELEILEAGGEEGRLEVGHGTGWRKKIFWKPDLRRMVIITPPHARVVVSSLNSSLSYIMVR